MTGSGGVDEGNRLERSLLHQLLRYSEYSE